MRLLRYERGTEWTVYLYCQDEEACQVLDVLTTCGDVGIRMLADLRRVASRPLESLNRDTEFSKHIDGTKLFEFRLPTSGGPTPRVAYFFDRDHVIVCALALLKKSDKLPKQFVDGAVDIRETYIALGGLKAADIEIYRHTDDEEDS